MATYRKWDTMKIEQPKPDYTQRVKEDSSGRHIKYYFDPQGNTQHVTDVTPNSGKTDTQRLADLMKSGADAMTNVRSMYGEDPNARAERVLNQQNYFTQAMDLAKQGVPLAPGANLHNLNPDDLYRSLIPNPQQPHAFVNGKEYPAGGVQGIMSGADRLRQAAERKELMPRLLEIMGSGVDAGDLDPEKISIKDLFRLSSQKAKKDSETAYYDRYMQMWKDLAKLKMPRQNELGDTIEEPLAPDAIRKHILDAIGPPPGQAQQKMTGTPADELSEWLAGKNPQGAKAGQSALPGPPMAGSHAPVNTPLPGPPMAGSHAPVNTPAPTPGGYAVNDAGFPIPPQTAPRFRPMMSTYLDSQKKFTVDDAGFPSVSVAEIMRNPDGSYTDAPTATAIGEEDDYMRRHRKR